MGGYMDLLLAQPSRAARHAVALIQELKQTMDYQRALMRSFSYEVFLEVMTPLQHAILVGRSDPYVMDIMAIVEALARERPDFQPADQLLS
ncbi:hypothetical protein WJX74_010211 [Apatococcus lobatus]|uniref:Uncharacterized protein n=1 Tax=Apatococcus lobatus TaxID=904363 RepID=A0AAW1QIX3_9CHLO